MPNRAYQTPSKLEMCYLPTEKWTKSIGKNSTDGITDRHNPSVRHALVIKKNEYYRWKRLSVSNLCNYTDGKSPSIIIASEIVTDGIKPTNY